jgi:hypothetical protein
MRITAIWIGTSRGLQGLPKEFINLHIRDRALQQNVWLDMRMRKVRLVHTESGQADSGYLAETSREIPA